MPRETIEEQIAAVLRAEPGIQLCDGCLALAAKVSLAKAQESVAALDRVAGFQVTEGSCSACRRPKIVVCALRQARVG